jgi:hypothetical protein
LTPELFGTGLSEAGYNQAEARFGICDPEEIKPKQRHAQGGTTSTFNLVAHARALAPVDRKTQFESPLKM